MQLSFSVTRHVKICLVLGESTLKNINHLLRDYKEQEARENFASPDDLFYGKLHIVKLLYH